MTAEPNHWFTSSYSENGGQCVEVAWFTSSHSNNGGQCVEVAASHGVVGVRDSKDPAGPALAFPADAFAAFITGVRDGEFGTV